MQRQEDRSREAIILSVLGPVRIRDDGIVVLFKVFFLIIVTTYGLKLSILDDL